MFDLEFYSFGFSHVPEQDAMRAVRFMLNYAEDHSIALRGLHPARTPFEDVCTWKLPASFNMANVWALYREAVRKLGEPVVEQIHFERMWEYFLPQITPQPKMEPCFQCYNFMDKLNANLMNPFGLCKRHLCEDIYKKDADESFSKIIREGREHEHIYKKEELLYQQMNAKCGMICKDSQLSLGPSRPASKKITMCYSFDFAQGVHYPSDPQHPGPMYFFIPRQCKLFGVCCGGLPKQVSYLIDEGMLPEKFPLINFIHHFFNNYGVGETCAILNSSESNRSQCLLWYCAWRTLHSLHLKLKLHFRIQGHDLSGPDLLFGLVKQALRKTSVQTLTDIAAVVRDSTPDKQLNVPQLVGLEDGTVFVETYDWGHLNTMYYRPFPHIERYRHFSFDACRPGVVTAKEHCDAEPVEYQVMVMLPVAAKTLPNSLRVQPPPGLSAHRQHYLFEKVRKFCSDEVKDIVCPRPKTKAPQRKL